MNINLWRRDNKTCQSGLHEKHLIQPKMFATKNSPRCPVNFFKTYLSKRPNHLRTTVPLYLGVIQNPLSDSVWYKTSPMGQNTIKSLMKRTVENFFLHQTSSKKLTNHSARETLVWP